MNTKTIILVIGCAIAMSSIHECANAQVIHWPDGTSFVGDGGRTNAVSDGAALTDPLAVDDSLSRKTVADVPGESIDPRTGELTR